MDFLKDFLNYPEHELYNKLLLTLFTIGGLCISFSYFILGIYTNLIISKSENLLNKKFKFKYTLSIGLLGAGGLVILHILNFKYEWFILESILFVILGFISILSSIFIYPIYDKLKTVPSIFMYERTVDLLDKQLKLNAELVYSHKLLIDKKNDEISSLKLKLKKYELSTRVDELNKITAKIVDNAHKNIKSIDSVEIPHNPLAKLSSRLKSLYYFTHNLPVACALIDINLKYLAWSKEWENFHNVSIKVGDSHLDVFPEIIENEKWLRMFEETLLDGKTQEGTETYYFEDGSKIVSNYVYKQVKDSNEVVVGLIMFISNSINTHG